MVCAACGMDLLWFFGKSGEYTYTKCLNCGTLQLSPMPDKLMIQKAYSGQYERSGHNTESCWVAQPRNQAIMEIINQLQVRGKIIEIGCGQGCLCQMMKEHGVDYIGFEISELYVQQCQEKGLNVVHGDIGSIPEESASVIIMIAVFEHLLDHDDFLDRCKKALKSDGVLIILSPTAHFASGLRKEDLQELPKAHNLFHPPWHTVLFTIKGMRYLMARHGLRLKCVKISPPGNKKGLDKIIRLFYIIINHIGFALTEEFPFIVSHIFIIAKSKGKGCNHKYIL